MIIVEYLTYNCRLAACYCIVHIFYWVVSSQRHVYCITATVIHWWIYMLLVWATSPFSNIEFLP